MTHEKPPAILSSRDLAHLTPARVGLGRSGASLTTSALLGFALDHARARDAVHAPFDSKTLLEGVRALDLVAKEVSSCATDRQSYLKRPDLGRKLDEASRASLTAAAGTECDVAMVIADGLSSAAVHGHALAMVRKLLPRWHDAKLTIGPVMVAHGARVALGDEIGALIKARLVVMLIGERPGLSAPDSLGCYITYAPRPGLSDADRNCVSNIHAGGLTYREASAKIVWLVIEAFARRMTGVQLKDESAGQPRLGPP